MQSRLVNTNSDNYSGCMSEQMAAKLRKVIHESGMSVLTLSKLCGVPQPRISDFLAGKDIRLATAQKLADHFGLVLTDKSRRK